MASKYFRMTQPRANEFGMWHPGVIYAVDEAAAAKVQAYVDAGVAEYLSDAEVKAMKAAAAAAAKAQAAAIAKAADTDDNAADDEAAE